MTKKEDLRKLFTEGRTGSKIALLSVFLFLSSTSLFSQDLINGFFNIRKETTFPGQSKIFITDFNNDSMNDYVFHGSGENFVSIHRSRRGKYAPPVNKFFFYPVTFTEKFNDIPKLGQFYFFISRRLRFAGLYQFSPYGTLQLMHRRRLDSFPSGATIFDIDSDGLLEAAVLGENFDGISILKQNNFTLEENKIASGKIFSAVGFSDFDYDGYADMYAFNIIDSKLEIYSNDGLGGLKYERAIPFISQPKCLLLDDVNGDGFTEILYSFRNGIEVLSGDSVSSFSEAKFFPTGKPVSAFRLFDFNLDKEKDLAYITDDGLYISFTREGNFGSGIKYLSDTKLTDLKTEMSDEGARLYALSGGGLFYTISNLTFSDGIEFQLPGRTTAVEFSDIQSDGDRDICYIDSANTELNILLSRKDQPAILLRDKLTLPHGKILISQFSDEEKIVLSYTEGNRLFEISRVDEKNLRIHTRSYYAPGNLRQLLINNREVNEQFYISGLYTSGDSLMYFTYFLQNFDLYPDEIEYIGNSTMASRLHFSNGVKLYTADLVSDSLHLSRLEFGVRIYSLEEVYLSLDEGTDTSSEIEFHKIHLPHSLNDIVTAKVGNENVIYDFFSDFRILPERRKNINGIATSDILSSSVIEFTSGAIALFDRIKSKIAYYVFDGGKFKLKKKFIVSSNTDSYFAGKFSDELNCLVYFDSKLNQIFFQGLDD